MRKNTCGANIGPRWSPNTIRNSQQSLESFLGYLEGTGKRDLEEIQRQDIEGFVEQEQDRGMKLSSVKNRLTIVKAFLRFMKEKGLIREEGFPWKLKINLLDTLPRAMVPEHVYRLLAAPGSIAPSCTQIHLTPATPWYANQSSESVEATLQIYERFFRGVSL
jgi:site-specific recombinase XerD